MCNKGEGQECCSHREEQHHAHHNGQDVSSEREGRKAAKHSGCWVCASREPFVKEPSMGRKFWNSVEDGHIQHGVSKLVQNLRDVYRVHVVLAIMVCMMSGVIGANTSVIGRQGLGLMSLTSLLALGVGVFGILAFNTTRTRCPQVVGKSVNQVPSILEEKDKKALATLLSGALRIKTVSYDPPKTETCPVTDYTTFLEMHEYLRKHFPLVHSSENISRTVINKYSLLYEWKGTNPDLSPVMFCAHLDVVPTPNASKWQEDPFSGKIDADGVVWGRGAIDNKHNVLCQMAALEYLLKNGKGQMERTYFFAFGHDEEIGGWKGACHIAKEMQARLKGKKLAFIFDEGTMVIKGLIPGQPHKEVGVIGNCEKGSISYKMTVSHAHQGHSSMPTKESNIGILSKALARLESRPFPEHMDTYLDSLSYLGSHAPGWLRAVVANSWLFKPILRAVTLKKDVSAASVRTTTALTVLKAGHKINVLPAEASAWVNHRIHPRDLNKENVLQYNKKVVNDDRVQFEESSDWIYTPPSPVTPYLNNPTWDLVQSSLAKVFGVPSIPSVMIGNTDTRHYWDLTDNIFRCSPIVLSMEETKMFHGLNERISTENLAKLHHFYVSMITDYR